MDIIETETMSPADLSGVINGVPVAPYQPEGDVEQILADATSSRDALKAVRDAKKSELASAAAAVAIAKADADALAKRHGGGETPTAERKGVAHALAVARGEHDIASGALGHAEAALAAAELKVSHAVWKVAIRDARLSFGPEGVALKALQEAANNYWQAVLDAQQAVLDRLNAEGERDGHRNRLLGIDNGLYVHPTEHEISQLLRSLPAVALLAIQGTAGASHVDFDKVGDSRISRATGK